MADGTGLAEVVVGAYDGMIIGATYDIHSLGLRPRFNEKGHLSMVTVMASSLQGVLASGSSDETIKLYNMRNRTEIGSLVMHEGTITGLQFCKNRLFSCGKDGLVCVWDCHSWECIHVLKGHRGVVNSIAVHPSCKLMLSVGNDKTIRTWDIVNGRQAFNKKLPNEPELIKWSPTGDQYIIGYNNNQLILYDVNSGTSIHEINIGKRINAIEFLQDKTELPFDSYNDNTGSPEVTMMSLLNAIYRPAVMDSLIAIGCELPDILIYSTANGQCITRLKGHDNRIKGLQCISNADLLFSVSSNGSIIVWKINNTCISESTSVSLCKLSSRLTSMSVIPPSSLEDTPPSLEDTPTPVTKRTGAESEDVVVKRNVTITKRKPLTKRKRLLLQKMRKKKSCVL